MSNITVEPSIKWPKFDQKMVENHKNYTGIFDFLPKMANFWPFGKCQKCTKLFVFLFSRKLVHFCENVPKFEILTIMHGLIVKHAFKNKCLSDKR